jgi:hypothetical protein
MARFPNTGEADTNERCYAEFMRALLAETIAPAQLNETRSGGRVVLDYDERPPR